MGSMRTFATLFLLVYPSYLLKFSSIGIFVTCNVYFDGTKDYLIIPLIKQIKDSRGPCEKKFMDWYQTPTVKHGGGNIKVWEVFSSNGISPLVQIHGNMDAVMYKDILQNHMLPFTKKKLPSGWVLQHDNDPKHVSRQVKNFLQSQKVQTGHHANKTE
ncbi:unnamed protein product [Euphydryas editha]|uniref:Transposase n=1 Tax=Euphydryas editha TaxID=104508 RepID=A0AAU9UY43_EUPED|nr:unnamed protein product [Euphydryas editha]